MFNLHGGEEGLSAFVVGVTFESSKCLRHESWMLITVHANEFRLPYNEHWNDIYRHYSK